MNPSDRPGLVERLLPIRQLKEDAQDQPLAEVGGNLQEGDLLPIIAVLEIIPLLRRLLNHARSKLHGGEEFDRLAMGLGTVLATPASDLLEALALILEGDLVSSSHVATRILDDLRTHARNSGGIMAVLGDEVIDSTPAWNGVDLDSSDPLPRIIGRLKLDIESLEEAEAEEACELR